VARIKLGVVVRKSRLHPLELRLVGGTSSISKLEHTSAHVSIRQRTSAYVRREAGGRLASKGGGRLIKESCRVYSAVFILGLIGT